MDEKRIPRVPLKKSYAGWLRKLDGVLHDVEHYRVPTRDEIEGVKVVTKFVPSLRRHLIEKRWKPTRFDHVSVAVLKDGRAFIGYAELSAKDAYSRRKGHAIAVGRALANAANSQLPVAHKHFTFHDFRVPTPMPEGVLLRDACRVKLEDADIIPRKGEWELGNDMPSVLGRRDGAKDLGDGGPSGGVREQSTSGQGDVSSVRGEERG